MSSKQMVLEKVREMSDEASFAEIIEELAILAAIQEGREDIQAGRFISHEEIKKQVASWTGR